MNRVKSIKQELSKKYGRNTHPFVTLTQVLFYKCICYAVPFLRLNMTLKLRGEKVKSKR